MAGSQKRLIVSLKEGLSELRRNRELIEVPGVARAIIESAVCLVLAVADGYFVTLTKTCRRVNILIVFCVNDQMNVVSVHTLMIGGRWFWFVLFRRVPSGCVVHHWASGACEPVTR